MFYESTFFRERQAGAFSGDFARDVLIEGTAGAFLSDFARGVPVSGTAGADAGCAERISGRVERILGRVEWMWVCGADAGATRFRDWRRFSFKEENRIFAPAAKRAAGALYRMTGRRIG